MDGEAKRSKRNAANERLRVGFLASAGPQLAELRELLANSGADGLESVAHELTRMANTARALGLTALSQAAERAAERAHLGETADADLLGPVTFVLQRALPAPLVGSLLVVAEGAHAERLTAQSEGVVERVRLVPLGELELARRELERPVAVVMPARPVDTIRRLHDEGITVLAYGEANDWALRTAAAEAGARAFLPAQFELDAALDLARREATAGGSDPAALVVADAGPHRAALVAALDAAGLPVFAAGSPSEIGPALHVFCPDVVVMGARFGDRLAERAIGTIRGHADCGDAVIVVQGQPAPSLWAAGADDAVAEVDPERIVDRVLRLARRAHAWPRDRDRVTHLPTRLATLRALDRHLANAGRHGEVLSVVLLRITGLETLRERSGRSGVNAARRALAAQLQRSVRRIDVVGLLASEVFVAALPGCRESEARPRTAEIVGGFEREIRGDQRLRGVGIAVGVADTETSVGLVVHRAAADLARARAAQDGR